MRRTGTIVVGAFALAVASCNANGQLPTGTGPNAFPPSSGVAAVTACTGQTPPPTPTPRSAPRNGRIVAKPFIRGLVDLGQVSADRMPEPPYNTVYYACQRRASIAAIVVNDTWADLQPDPASAALSTVTIDSALREIARYDDTSGSTLQVRLRVWAGIDAPPWAKKLDGGPVDICDQDAVPVPTTAPVAAATPTPCPSPAVRTVGKFWSTPYATAWRKLQQMLAARYDGDLAVTELSIASCSSLTDEPFVQPEDAFSKLHLIDAGYTDAKYERCLSEAIPLDYAPYWRLTPLDYSFNPFREIQPKQPQTDLAFTKRAIDGCRAAIGTRCVLLNETMAKFTPPPSPAPGATPSQSQAYYEMWAYMKARGGAIAFQTASPPNLQKAWGTSRAGWDAAIRLAHEFGAYAVELFPQERAGPCVTPPSPPAQGWINGYSCFSKATLAGWKRQIQ